MRDFANVLLAIGVIALLVAALVLVRRRTAQDVKVSLLDISRVLAQLSAATSTPAFAAFALSPPSTGGQDLNLQFSLEEDVVGFDWVLLAPVNVADEVKFIDFARSEGFAPELKEMNNVRYVRVEDGDLARLFRDVIIKMYGVPQTVMLDLMAEGFTWRP